MNENFKSNDNYTLKILEKMRDYNLLKQQLTPFTAVAFDWFYPEWGNPKKISLVVDIIKLSSKNGSYDFVDKKYTFDIELSSRKISKEKGTSKPSGLRHKTFSYDEEEQGIFERNLADVIMYILYNDILKDKEETILIQGPLWPKLIGRLGYRFIKKEITIAALTFKNEWLPLESLQNNTELNKKFNSKFYKIPDNNEYCQLADIQFSDGLSEAMKSWGLNAKDKIFYVLELFNQFPYEKEDILTCWIDKLKKIQEIISSSGIIIEEVGYIWLPFSLACAYDYCTHYGKRTSSRINQISERGTCYKPLYYYENDEIEMIAHGFSSIEITGRKTLLYKGLSDENLYGEIIKNIKDSSFLKSTYQTHKEQLENASTIDLRGDALSGFLRTARDNNVWDINLWRKII